MNGQIIDHISRLPGLRSKRAFALYVQGESMWPWKAPGNIIIVNPDKPPRNGDYVVVEMKQTEEGGDRQAYVKRLVRQTPTKIVLAQYNPPREIELARDAVEWVYLVQDLEDLL